MRHWRTAALAARLAALTLLIVAALAPTLPAGTDFVELRRPGHLGLTIFGSGFGSDTYSNTHAGFQLEQSITNQLGAVARVSAWQIYQGKGYDSPFPTGATGVRTFERFQGGVDFTPVHGFSLIVLGGRDVGNSHAAVIEGDFSGWMFLASRHPINFSFSSSHYYENDVTSSRIDLRRVVYSTGRWFLMAGGGGAIWGGGTVGQPNGQGGPDLSLYIRELRTSIDLQFGYGSSHLYGLVGISTTFGWDE